MVVVTGLNRINEYLRQGETSEQVQETSLKGWFSATGGFLRPQSYVRLV